MTTQLAATRGTLCSCEDSACLPGCLQDIILPASDESEEESESQSGASERGSFEQTAPVLQTHTSAAMHMPDLTRTMSTRSASTRSVLLAVSAGTTLHTAAQVCW